MPNVVEVQLRKAQEMRATALEFAIDLIREMDKLEEKLYDNVRMGFPMDIADTYKGRYYDPDRGIIEALSDDIRSRHIEFLDNVIAHLQGALDE